MQPIQTTRPLKVLRRRRDEKEKDCDVKMKLHEGILVSRA